MKSKEKIEVLVKPFDKYGGKFWVMIRLLSGAEWIPSFEDLFRIIRAICYCEDEKYRPSGGRGRFYVRDFLKDCCEELRPGQSLEEKWQELKEKYKFISRN